MNLYNFHEKSDDLKGHNERHDLVVELAWEQVEKNRKATPKQEDTIAKDPFYSYLYAFIIIKRRWSKGEDAIAKSARFSCFYARDVIKGPFPKGEDTIAKDKSYKDEYEEMFGVKL